MASNIVLRQRVRQKNRLWGCAEGSVKSSRKSEKSECEWKWDRKEKDFFLSKYKTFIFEFIKH